jgi:hypothetical protein
MRRCGLYRCGTRVGDGDPIRGGAAVGNVAANVVSRLMVGVVNVHGYSPGLISAVRINAPISV